MELNLQRINLIKQKVDSIPSNSFMKTIPYVFTWLIRFYYDGFRNMSSWGKKVWLIIMIKLFIVFAILKVLFFPDFLGRKYSTDVQRSEYVRNQILNTPVSND